MELATRLPGTDLGSPHGVTTQDKYVHELWTVSYLFSVPIGLLVLGLILWCVFRYRDKGDGSGGGPGGGRTPAQFQYHIPLEAAYTIIPLVIVAILFGFLYSAENHVDSISKTPAIKITVEGFQWGWRFDYPNGHKQVGTVANELDINSEQNLPVLVIPDNETVQLHVVSLDVVHTFYVPEFLFQRDLIPGIDNTFDINPTTPGIYPGQCNNICGEYHAYMRFLVDVMPPSEFNTWYSQQAPNSITTAGEPQS